MTTPTEKSGIDSTARSNMIVSATILAVLGVAAGVEWFGESVATGPVASAPLAADEAVARGRYLVQIAGCNDCHTPGYAKSGGRVPEALWLTGDAVGFRGPWGTIYPTNLRLSMRTWSENEWVGIARVIKTRPPMPWFNLRDMSEDDLRAIYRYVGTLPPAGNAAPARVPPDREPATSFFVFVSQPPRQAQAH